MAGLAEYAKKVEGAWSIRKGAHEDSIILTGSDLLDILATGSSQAPTGAEVYVLPLSPTDTGWMNTRLQQFAPLFQRFKFRKFSVKYEPIANATISGQLLHYVDFDTDSNYSPVNNSLAAIQFAAAHKKNEPFQVWEESRAAYRPDGEIQTLFLAPGASGSDPRLYSQGRYHIFNVSAPPSNNTPLGVLYAEYEIELWDSALGTGTLGGDPDLPSPGVLWDYTFPGLVDDGTDVVSSSESYGVWLLNGGEGGGKMTPTGGDMDDLDVEYSNTTHQLTVNGWPYTQIALQAGMHFAQDEEITRTVGLGFTDPFSLSATNATANAFWISGVVNDHTAMHQSGVTGTQHATNDIDYNMVWDVTTVGSPIIFTVNTVGGSFDMSAGPDPYHYTTIFRILRNGAFHNTDPKPVRKRNCFWSEHSKHFGKYHKSCLHVWTPKTRCRCQCEHCDEQAKVHRESEHKEEILFEKKQKKNKRKEDKEDMLLNMMKMLVENLTPKKEVPPSDDESLYQGGEPEKEEEPKTDAFHRLLFERFAAATEVSSIKLLEGLLCRVPCSLCEKMRTPSRLSI
jgi:hypothetical protein